MTGGRALLSDGNFFILACTAGWWRRGCAEAGGVGGSEPPCHADAWLLSLVVSQRQTAAADELSGVADELVSLQVSQRQSAAADELSGVVDERRCRRLTQPTAQSNSFCHPRVRKETSLVTSFA